MNVVRQARSVYGMHATLWLTEIERTDVLDDRVALDYLLHSLVKKIGMTVLDGPLMSTEQADPLRYGHSGVVILVESHAAIHTYPKIRSLFFDMFSCKPFEMSDVCAVFAEELGHFVIAEQEVRDRGRHWGAVASRELQRWQEQR